MLVNFYKLMRHLQWGTHLGLAGGKHVKNNLMDILLMALFVPGPLFELKEDIPFMHPCPFP